ncbi:MAG TPA: S8 family peptidase [Candidatus Limnocylindria bacterium]|nr:S8 family peptidase [Candidatus Limnocylindria bacterium]
MTGTARAVQRWLGAALCLAILIATQSAPSEARSVNAAKIDPVLLQEVLADPRGEFDVIVRGTPADSRGKSRSGDRLEKVSKAITSRGGKTHYGLGIIGGGVATINGRQLLELLSDNDVDYVFKNVTFRATWDPALDASKAATPGILATNAPQAWQQYGTCGRGVGVAVVDSGVYPHPDLAGRIVAAVDFTSASVTNTTPVNVAGDPGGHGTHVAGLVAGNGTASGGAFTGTAPCANVVDVRVIDANGVSNTGIILRGLQWVLANRSTYNIKVTNMSFGATQSGSYKTDPLATAAQVLNFAGIAVVVSAGNSGPTVETVTSPGADPFVITVGAIDDNGTATLADDLMATFSSRGRTKYDRLNKPDLVAPGRKMVSALAPGSTIPTMYPDRLVTAPGALVAEYMRLSGTSMAAPVVSGIVALMVERNSSLTPGQIKSRLKKNTTPIAYGGPQDKGAGLVNALKAVASVDPDKEYSEGRVTDSFAKDMRRFVQGQPIPWRDLFHNGGVDSRNVTWGNITWENITWDNITWDNITWENFTWENITWETITWETITWQSSAQQSLDALSGSGSGFAGMVD